MHFILLIDINHKFYICFRLTPLANLKLKRGHTSEKEERKEDPFKRNWSEQGLRVVKKTYEILVNFIRKLFWPDTKWKVPIQRDWSENSRIDDNFLDSKISPIKRK